jgi:hypothetical protein
MINPPPYPYSSSFDDILKRITRQMNQNQVDSRVLELLRQVFEIELGKENVVLSRPERARLFQQITRSILTDVLGKIDDTE